MKRLGIGACAFLLVLAVAYLTPGNNSETAQASAPSAADRPVPLFDSSTKLEPATVEDTPEALITRVGDRGRDRHAREWMFHAYDHYLPHYWEYRTVGIEIVDRVAKGGDSVTYNMTSLWPLNGPNLRAFFRGVGTVAEYSQNTTSKRVDPLHYTMTFKMNTQTGKPIKIGDRIETEFSPFLVSPPSGRSNYYGTAFLYVVGQGGMVPWEWHEEVSVAEKKRGLSLDSYPMPEEAWQGGRTTLHQQYSDEPKSRFQQLATNLSPINAQPFMLGRRIHHTDFATGAHSEPDNPIYTEQAGKLGNHYVGRSCISCHASNGKALPAAVGQPMVKYAVHVGIDAKGTPHPKLGATLQSQALKGSPEGGVTIGSWTTTDGKYGDGSAYSLQKPSYKFTGVVPEYYSVRLAPALVGQGLLEALDENTIAAGVKKNDDGISGRMNTVTDPEHGQLRMGRFGWKATQPTLKDQIASALNNDMGIPTPIYPKLDRGSEQEDPGPGKELGAADLDNLYRYVALLGVPPRRNLEDPQAKKGEAVFASASCVKCHTATMKTSAYDPFSELRGQTVHPYTDMLLHDMGSGLADNMGEGNVTGAEWRTSPLWGIGLGAGVSGGEAYLHDGRARNLSEAILWHGGEAEKSKEAFRTMPEADRAALIKFLKSL